MGDPAPGGDDDHPEDYIIIADTDSDPDSSDDDYKDEAGADIMESSTDQKFQMTTILSVELPPCIQKQSEHFVTVARSIVCPCLKLSGVI